MRLNVLPRFAVRALALVLAAASSLLVGCRDAEGVEAEAWVRQVCTDLLNFTDQLQTSNTNLQASVQGEASLAEARQRIVTFFDEAVRASDQLRGSLARVGKPAVENGATINRELRQGIDQTRNSFVDAKTRSEGLSVDDPTAFQREAAAVGQDIRAASERARGDIARLRSSKELEQAADKEPACRKLQERRADRSQPSS